MFLLGAGGRIIETVDYNRMASHGTRIVGAVKHSGDVMEGASGCHTLDICLRDLGALLLSPCNYVWLVGCMQCMKIEDHAMPACADSPVSDTVMSLRASLLCMDPNRSEHCRDQGLQPFSDKIILQRDQDDWRIADHNVHTAYLLVLWQLTCLGNSIDSDFSADLLVQQAPFGLLQYRAGIRDIRSWHLVSNARANNNFSENT